MLPSPEFTVVWLLLLPTILHNTHHKTNRTQGFTENLRWSLFLNLQISRKRTTWRMKLLRFQKKQNCLWWCGLQPGWHIQGQAWFKNSCSRRMAWSFLKIWCSLCYCLLTDENIIKISSTNRNGWPNFPKNRNTILLWKEKIKASGLWPAELPTITWWKITLMGNARIRWWKSTNTRCRTNGWKNWKVNVTNYLLLKKDTRLLKSF